MRTAFVHHPRLWSARLSLPEGASAIGSRGQSAQLAAGWQTIGGLLRALARETDLDPAAALAVWNVESGPWPFRRGKPVLRLECHKLWEHWGCRDTVRFERHFRFGGHAGTPGAPWSNHAMRNREDAAWRSFHGDQVGEYEAFALAARLAGPEAACLSSSFGGPQILGSNHAKLGYPDAISLYRAFGRSLRAQVLGFMDFCRSEALLPALAAQDWLHFARVYNGPGMADSYAEKICDAHVLASAVVTGNVQALHQAEQRLSFDHATFDKLMGGLGLRHFSAREFLFRGRRNSASGDSAFQLNGFPPPALWRNIIPLALAVDAFRAEIGSPVSLASIYRTPAFNEAIGGAPDSEHTRFAAIDVAVPASQDARRWREVMAGIRARGVFSGAIGLHDGALHLDGSGQNIDV